MNWERYSFIISSKYRVKILESIKEFPKTPTQISREMKILRPHVSKTLLELEKKGIIKCLVPKNKKGRIYTLTRMGKEMTKRISI